MALALTVAMAFLLHSAAAAPAPAPDAIPQRVERRGDVLSDLVDQWVEYWQRPFYPPKQKTPERFYTCDANVTFHYEDMSYEPWPDWVNIKDCKAMVSDIIRDKYAPEQWFYSNENRGRWLRLGHWQSCSFLIRAYNGGFYFGAQDFIDIINTATDTYPEYAMDSPDFVFFDPEKMGPVHGTVGKCKPTFHNSTRFAEDPADWVENVEWTFARADEYGL
jgi:hypothetical protein